MHLILRTVASALLLTLLVIFIAIEQGKAQGQTTTLTIREGLPDTDVTVKQVTYGNGIYLACLIYPVRLYSSLDGINWSKITGPPLGQDSNINAYRQQASIAFGAGRFVLTSDSGRIFSSADLSTWTPSASGTTNNIATVQYLNGNFYAVGDAGLFLSSPDGLTWTMRTIGVPNPGYDYQEVLYGNGHLVITSVVPHVVYDSSSAGWRADSSRQFNEHGFARGRFYEFSVNSNMVSTDMQNWSPISVAPDAGAGFAVFEDSTQVYLLSGNYDVINGSQVWDGRISVSPDGINFGPINSKRVAGQGGGAYFNHRYFIYPGTAHSLLTGSADGVHFYTQGSNKSLLATNGLINVKLTLTADGAYIYTSEGFTNWIPRDTISGVATLFYDGNDFWAVGTETFTSPDGITWTEKGASVHAFNGMAYGSGTYIAWGPGDEYGDSLWYSSDGANWAHSTTPQGVVIPRAPPTTIPYGSVVRVRILNGHIFIFATGGTLYSTDASSYGFMPDGLPGGDIAYDADSARYYFLGVGTDSVGKKTIITASVTDPATGAGARSVVGSLTGPAADAGVSGFYTFAYGHGHFFTTFDDGSFPPYPSTYLLYTSDQLHWESRLLDRQMEISSSLAANDTMAIEGTHAYEIIASFSNGSVLPVTLLNFQAAAQDNTKALLTWQTASEQASRHFIVQRNGGVNTYSWDSIGVVPAAGNSNSLLNYTFTDQYPLMGANYYRLALVNADNNRQYSEVREVSIIRDAAITVYPNPAREQLVIQRTIDNGAGIVMLYDAEGRVVLQRALTGTGLTLSLGHLAAGAYQLIIRQPNAAVYRQQILHY
ncbi:MAG TPA: T9SS type A sorting domain-containing protein [Puia sp.]|nr:T9SS type A sorting domain-containing protein [Puia sp.]